jgi:MoxR-like ATPase
MQKEASQILNEVRKGIVGKDDLIREVLLAVLAGGHILLEDVPGVGKTTLALAFSKVLSLDYNRIQLTPDVMPSDITGFSLYRKETGEMEYQPGVALCNLLLADELNRATSRTQSALLEAMEEHRVTVDGVGHPVPEPFVVIATQNPVGAAGTQLLPDSQLDRFMVRLSMGYPAHEDEIELLRRKQTEDLLALIQPLIDGERLLELRREVGQVFAGNAVLDYIVRLAVRTRSHPQILQGASPRAALAVTAMAKAAAWIEERDYVLPEDVEGIFVHTVAHRLILNSREDIRGVSQSELAREILKNIPAPRVH